MSLTLHKLKFTYGKKPVIDIDELSIAKNEKVFLWGSSGSGKTTLLSLIAGITRPNSGSIKVLDSELNSIPTAKIDSFRGEKIGFIFQSFNLIPYLSVLENILLPASFQRKEQQLKARALELISDLNLSGLEDQKAAQLSVGQQQRVAAARAILTAPPLVIADEPTSSLDEDNVAEFMKLLLDSWEKQPFTLLFVSHDQRLGKYFDRSVELGSINKVAKK